MSGLLDAGRKALRVVTRPVRRAVGEGGVVLQPYRGYGSQDEIFLIGRVFRQPTAGQGLEEASLSRSFADLGRRLLRRGLGGAVLTARFCGAEQRLRTDRDGYFRVHLRLNEPPPADRVWHEMALELESPATVATTGKLFIPPPGCRFVVISDIDDTVMHTGVANKAAMLWNLFMEGAESRIAFAGMSAFLNALHDGVSGKESNPMLYVSRAPWSIYEVLDEFFNQHRIPVGPVLFLREWGLTLQSPLPRRAKGHKLELIRNMLQLYEALPFILVGDSGQRDPEIYAQVVRENRGRVQAIYIRNVSREPERRAAIEALAIEVAEAGSTLLLAADSLAMASHAAERGLIALGAIARVQAEKVDQGEPAAEPIHTMVHDDPSAVRDAVERGKLGQALDQGTDATPPNIVVEPRQSG